MLGPPVVLDRPADARALGVPQHQAGAHLVGHGKQVQLAADLAVVAALGLFQPREVRLQRVLGGERGAVDPLEHLVLLVAPPVGARDRHQLEVRHGRGGRQVGSFAEVDEIALAVQAHGRVGDPLDDLDLVRLAALAKEADRVGLGQILALDRLRGAGQLAHRRLDLLEIVRGEGAVELEIVIEAVLDRRADRQLRAGEQPFDRLSHQVRGAMADRGKLVVARWHGTLRKSKQPRRTDRPRTGSIAHRAPGLRKDEQPPRPSAVPPCFARRLAAARALEPRVGGATGGPTTRVGGRTVRATAREGFSAVRGRAPSSSRASAPVSGASDRAATLSLDPGNPPTRLRRCVQRRVSSSGVVVSTGSRPPRGRPLTPRRADRGGA